jgi:pleiotropic regulator 1
LGWVRSIAFDPSNEWFATGSADRTIKIWNLAKCCAGSSDGLRLTLTGHINAVRGMAVSPRHPYLFSGGEDKMVKCWDLETNKCIRHYHGHLSGVYCLALHPTLDVLITGGRDSVARVWDMRTKHEIHVLGGHENTVASVFCNSIDPQIVTGSYDSTIKLWDLATGRSMATLTHHKKGIRALRKNPNDLTFVSFAADNIKKWQLRDGAFLNNMTGYNQNHIVNAAAINEEGVCVAGGDEGTLDFMDYNTGHHFQTTRTVAQPGSLNSERGVYAMEFDLSGSRLVTCEADKTIKIWKEEEDVSEETHPIDMEEWGREFRRQRNLRR